MITVFERLDTEERWVTVVVSVGGGLLLGTIGMVLLIAFGRRA
jgi:hypothetical protein